MPVTLDGVQDKNNERESPSLLTRLIGALSQGWSYFSFSHMAGLLDKGDAGDLDPTSAVPFHPKDANPAELQSRFESIYYDKKVALLDL